jgi:SM-20-related protein
MSQFQNHFYRIADGLAETGFAVVDDFLSPPAVQQILSLHVFNDESFKKAGIGKETKQINEEIRGDSILWLDKETAHEYIKNYLARIEDLRLYLKENLYLSLKDFECHLAAYPPGSFYKRHLDQFKSDDHRRISVITYLNQNWKDEEGGQLRMYLESGHLDFLPNAGRMICFRSDKIDHEVLPATRERLSITGWLLDQYSDLRYLK